MIKKRNAFTLIEVTISSAIMGLIIIGVFYYLNGNLKIYESGKNKISFQGEVQKVMKYLYVEIKKVNPSVYMDSKLNVVLDDEYRNDLKLSPIELIDLNNNVLDGFERINFWEQDIQNFSDRKRVSFFIDKGLVKEVVDRGGNIIGKTIISKYVSKLKFFRNEYDSNVLKINVELIGEKTKKGSQKDNFELIIRMDTDFITLK